MQGNNADHTLARSQVYALLAEAFSFPEGEAVLRLLDGDLIADLQQALSSTTYNIDFSDTLPMPATKNAVQEMQVIYTELFDVTGGTPKVSLLERRYCDTPEQELWEKLLRFYTHFGLDFSTEDVAEQPDHLLTELSFMHYLGFLEAGCSNSADRPNFQRGERDFINLHIGNWVKSLADSLAEQEILHPYKAFAALAARFIAYDKAYLNDLVPEVVEQVN